MSMMKSGYIFTPSAKKILLFSLSVNGICLFFPSHKKIW